MAEPVATHPHDAVYEASSSLAAVVIMLSETESVSAMRPSELANLLRLILDRLEIAEHLLSGKQPAA